MDTNHTKSLFTWQWMELVELPRKFINDLGMTWERAQGQMGEYKQKDNVKMQLMKKELEEWKRSSYPLQRDPNPDDGEDEE
jgi:hypothetical protein